MRRLLRFTLLLVGLAFLGGCASYRTVVVAESEPPGQIRASRVHTRNGIRFYERGHYKKAIQQFELAIAKDRSNWEAHYYLAECYRELREYDPCLRHYRIVLELRSEPVWVARVEYKMGWVYERRGKYKDARSHYELALGAVPSHREAKEAKRRLESKKYKDRDDDDDDRGRRGKGKKEDD
ncbi:MAG: tetratricopeptide repeat protein [candidate division Zixibacteria bacterium]|nr:tetratricopeptide repeat protein [candidate division Zixibacteria bacterium]MCI0595753.1 tetratricopeptide repeat protein [candidate division Zixibacteria bacterium]